MNAVDLHDLRTAYDISTTSKEKLADFERMRYRYYIPKTPALKAQLARDGYVHIPAALPKMMVDFFRERFAEVFNGQKTPEYNDTHKGIGSLFDMLEFPMAVDLAADPWLLGLRNRLGFLDAKFTYGIVFNKAPHTPRTFWHQDGTVWNTDFAYEDTAPEILQAFYLDGSNENYGALRVLPGTHRRRHALHDVLANTPKADLRSAKDLSSPAFADQEGEVTIATQPGDMVFMDARVLHSTHANARASDRMTVTLSFLSRNVLADERVLARYTPKTAEPNTRVPYIPEGFLPLELRRAYARVLPSRYQGEESPLPYCNTPRWVSRA